jgi:hypothetical protein
MRLASKEDSLREEAVILKILPVEVETGVSHMLLFH